MVDPNKKPIEPGEPTEPAVAKPDPYDLETLRLDPSFLEMAGVKKVLATVPVGRPHPQDFVRVRPGKEYRNTFAVVDWKEDREFYVVVPTVAAELPGECVSVALYTCINRQGVVRLWPIKLPGPDGRVIEWHRSQAEAAEFAIDSWCASKRTSPWERTTSSRAPPHPSRNGRPRHSNSWSASGLGTG
jgi:hypothetical protein